MDSALAEIAYLARSATRVAALRSVVEEPRTRADLRNVTGASSSTLSRVLAELDGRSYVGRDGHQYHATPLGELVVEAFDPLERQMARVHGLRVLAEWLRHVDVGLDFQELAEAEIVTPSPEEPTAHVDRQEAELRDASRVRFVSFAAVYRHGVVIHERLSSGDLTCEWVHDVNLRDKMRHDPRFRALMEAFLAAGSEGHYYDGQLPFSLFVVDGKVLLWLCRDGIARGLVVSKNPRVYEWAVERFESFRAGSEPVTTEWLAA